MQANVQVFKNYRSKVVKVISDTIMDKLEATSEMGIAQLPFLRTSVVSTQDLIMIERDVVACFPQEWDVACKNGIKELEIPPELLQPPLLGGYEQSLIDDYLKLIVKKLDEWSANPMKTELNEFTLRAEPPELDTDGQYRMRGAVIPFQMVHQQVGAANRKWAGHDPRLCHIGNELLAREFSGPSSMMTLRISSRLLAISVT